MTVAGMTVTGMKSIQYEAASNTYRVIDKTTAFSFILALCVTGTEIGFYVNHTKEVLPGTPLNDFIDRDFDKLKIRLDADGSYKDRFGKVFKNIAEYDKHCLETVYAPVPDVHRGYVPSDVSVQSIRVVSDGKSVKDCIEVRDHIDSHDTIVFRETKHQVVDTNIMDYYRTKGMIFPIDEGYTFSCIAPNFYSDDAIVLESYRQSRNISIEDFNSTGTKAVKDLVKRECTKMSTKLISEVNDRVAKRSRDLFERFNYQFSEKRVKSDALSRAHDLRVQLAQADEEVKKFFPTKEAETTDASEEEPGCSRRTPYNAENEGYD